ncbi:MAG: hypothetical protein ACRCWR_02605 [Saezia sp.]
MKAKHILLKSAKTYTVLLWLFTVVTLTGCGAVYEATSLHEKGKYFESSEVITNELDRKGEFPKGKDGTTMLNILNDGILEFERRWNGVQASTDVSFNIYEYKRLLQFRNLFENKFYSPQFFSFVDNYPVKTISLKVAEQYYLKAEAIHLDATINYNERANLYSTGLSYGKYKDIEQKASFYKKEYATRSAGDFYQEAIAAEESKKHQLASELFKQACTAYKAYGDYKDCQSRASKNDRVWRTQSAEAAYQKGVEAEQLEHHREAHQYFSEADSVYTPYGVYKDSRARAIDNDKRWRSEMAEQEFERAQNIASGGRKKNFRQAADAYQKAYEHYKSYGDYRNASQHAKKYSEMGIVEYGVDIISRNSRYSPGFSIESLVHKGLNASYYRQSYHPEDFSITVDYNYKCEENQQTKRDPQSWKDRDGNVRYYTTLKTTFHNSCSIKGFVSTRGAISYHYPFDIKVNSSEEKVAYEGDAPRDTQPFSNGHLKSLSTLQKDAEQDMRYEIEQAVSAIRSRADQL